MSEITRWKKERSITGSNTVVKLTTCIMVYVTRELSHFFASDLFVFKLLLLLLLLWRKHNVSDKVVQSLFSFASCIVWNSVIKEGPNPLPVLDRSRDHCYHERCPLRVGRPESWTFISFLYHTDSHGSNIWRSFSALDPWRHSTVGRSHTFSMTPKESASTVRQKDLVYTLTKRIIWSKLI